MGNHRKSIFDVISIITVLFWIAHINNIIVTAAGIKIQTELNDEIIETTPTPPLLLTVETKLLTNILNGEDENTIEEIIIKFGPDHNNNNNNNDNDKFQRVAINDQDKKQNETNRKKEDFSVFASFFVEIIVFFVFLAILLSFITICAKKCGGSPSHSRRIYGPGPIMGGLMTDPDEHEYEPVSGLTHGFARIGGYPIQTTNFTNDYHHYVQNDPQRFSIPPSEYSDYQSESDDIEKSKRSRKKKIPGPTF